MEENISGRSPLPQDGLISQPSLKRAQKINRIEFSLSFSMDSHTCIAERGIEQKK